MNNKYKTKIFFGTMQHPADYLFNDFIKNNYNIKIQKFIYRQAQYIDHSICILYTED